MTDLLTRLAEDREIAEAATPGPWTLTMCETWRGEPGAYEIEAANGNCIADNEQYYPTAPDDQDAVFIARFSPDYVLKLVALTRVAVEADKSCWTAEIECWPEVREALKALAEHGETP